METDPWTVEAAVGDKCRDAVINNETNSARESDKFYGAFETGTHARAANTRVRVRTCPRILKRPAKIGRSGAIYAVHGPPRSDPRPLTDCYNTRASKRKSFKTRRTCGPKIRRRSIILPAASRNGPKTISI